MKVLLEIGNKFAKQSDWKDFALTKFCLCSMGIIIGIMIPKSLRQTVMNIALIVFVITYMILMNKVFNIVKEMMSKIKK